MAGAYAYVADVDARSRVRLSSMRAASGRAASGGRRSARGGDANGKRGGSTAHTRWRRQDHAERPPAAPSSWCSNQQGPAAQAHLHGRTTGRCPAQLIVGVGWGGGGRA
jgi:hypothetical protein